MHRGWREIARRLKCFLAGFLWLIASQLCGPWANAASGDYPTKSVTLVVPFSAGGFSDILARLLSQKLSEKWNVPVVVENVVGAGGNLGGLKVARASPDGYTLLLANTATNAINQSIFKKMEFDPTKAFVPVVLIVKTPNAIIVSKDLKASSLGELIALLKSRPGEFNYGSSGTGTTVQLTGELFQSATGVSIVHVPYKGSSPVMAALQGNSVQLTFDNSVSWAPLILSGQVRALAIASSRRSALLPDVPTTDEAGLKHFEASSWFGIAVPRGTPEDIVRKLNRDLNDVIRTAEFSDRMKGGEIVGGTSQEFSAFIDSESAMWARAVRQSGIEEM